MQNIEYDVYVKDTLNLVKTMVIKFEELGVLDNKVLENSGFDVDRSNKKTWRYYLNLNGEYHVTDIPMYVISLDTGETILFSKVSLVTHLATKRAYGVGGYYYNRLTDTYPGQFDLINCIIDPIDIDYAISERSYKILKYNKKLVLWNEEQLIGEIQKSIDGFVYDAFDTEYLNTDNLMLTTLIGTLYGKLPSDIMNIRLDAVGRRYAHEFHIWSRINSYGDFYGYKDLLDNTQTMWLYKNIHWVLKNAGKQWTFGELINILLTHRNIPLSKYTINKNTKNQPDDLVSTPTYIRENINLLGVYGTTPTFFDTSAVIDKEVTQAKDNAKYRDDYLDEAISKTTTGLHTQLPTKVLESEMEDSTNVHDDSLMKTLIYEWMYLAFNGVYNTVIDFEDPKSGKNIKITTSEAGVLWNYLLGLSRGEACIMVQPTYYEKVMRLDLPSVDDILQFGTDRYIDEELAKDIRDISTDFNRIINPESFFKKCVEVYQLKWKHKKLYSQFYDFKQFAEVKHATESMYTAGKVYLTDYKFYDEFLNDLDIDLLGYSSAEYDNLAWVIFCKVTGWDLFDHYGLRDIQSNLIQLMKKLSSYTIQFVTTMYDGSETISGDNRLSLTFDSGSTSVFNTEDMIVPITLHVNTRHVSNLNVRSIGNYDNRISLKSLSEMKCDVPVANNLKEYFDGDSNVAIGKLFTTVTVTDATDYWGNYKPIIKMPTSHIGGVRFDCTPPTVIPARGMGVLKWTS